MESTIVNKISYDKFPAILKVQFFLYPPFSIFLSISNALFDRFIYMF